MQLDIDSYELHSGQVSEDGGAYHIHLARNDCLTGLERLPFKPGGYNFWTWRGHKIHYVQQGEGFPIVLIHGFGASAFHWRFPFLPLACVFVF